MFNRVPARSKSSAMPQGRSNAAGLFGLAMIFGMGLMLSGCNTTAGVGKDVSATGAAVTRGANDVKTGL